MPRITFGKKGGRIHATKVRSKSQEGRSPEDVVRDLKKQQERFAGEDYRERSLALHGLICARCGREFDESTRHLLTVHHKDGNHSNNPLDGSNWENLCAYCHEDVHSRELLGEYLQGAAGGAEGSSSGLDLRTEDASSGKLGSLGEKLRKAMEKKEGR
ncbi:MAG TPA: YajD family HNH nuclease [Syntrophales bacterium]|nr:YajD family HNH nuclease [Syntrophales bacterium]